MKFMQVSIFTFKNMFLKNWQNLFYPKRKVIKQTWFDDKRLRIKKEFQKTNRNRLRVEKNSPKIPTTDKTTNTQITASWVLKECDSSVECWLSVNITDDVVMSDDVAATGWPVIFSNHRKQLVDISFTL